MKQKRKVSVSVGCPIVYGSVAHYLGKKAADFATHRWTLFIRGPNNEDLSMFVAKVAFTLHSSFAQPVREILNYPFEVTEMGWGEFESRIRVFFKDPTEQPIDLFHTIRLYPPGMPQQLSQKKPVVAEQYDEIVFSDPNEQFLRMLMSYTPRLYQNTLSVEAADTSKSVPKALKRQKPTQSVSVPTTNIFNEFSTIFDDSMDLEAFQAVQNHLAREIDVARIQLLELETQIVDFTHKLKLEKELAASSNKSTNADSNTLNSGMAQQGSQGGMGTSKSAKSRARGGASGKSNKNVGKNAQVPQPFTDGDMAQGSIYNAAQYQEAGSGPVITSGSAVAVAAKKKRPPKKKTAPAAGPTPGIATNM